MDKMTRFQELSDKATAAPWEVSTHICPSGAPIIWSETGDSVVANFFYDKGDGDYGALLNQDKNADLIAATRNELPALLSLLRQQHEALVEIKRREDERIARDRRINPNGLTEASLQILASEAIAAYDAWNTGETQS